MSWLTDPAADPDDADTTFGERPVDPDDGSAPTGGPRRRLGAVAAVVAGWLIVSVIVLAVLLAVRGPHRAATRTTPAAGPTVTASSTPGAYRLPAGFTQRAADDETDCAGHSYGRIKEFFARTPCLSVHRVLSTTDRVGRSVVVASYAIRFAGSTEAQQFNVLVTSDGTGNINDLLREGRTFPGGPARLPAAAFASRQEGNTVLVAEAGYVTGTSDPSDAALLSTAHQAVAGA